MSYSVWHIIGMRYVNYIELKYQLIEDVIFICIKLGEQGKGELVGLQKVQNLEI